MEHALGDMLSPAQAAQRLGISRWTVQRAITAGELRAIRNNRGHWLIALIDLNAWRDVQDAPSAPKKVSDDQAIKITTLEVENRHLLERVEELIKERDWLRRQLEARPEFPPAAEKRRGWWPFRRAR